MHKTSLQINKLSFVDKKRVKEALLFHLSNLREDIYLNSLKTKSIEIKTLTKENNKLHLKNQTLIEEVSSLKEAQIELSNKISTLEKSKIEYEKSIKKLKQALTTNEKKVDNTELEVLKKEIEKNKEQIQKDFNDKKELAKMVKKFKGEIDSLKEEIKLFQNNPNLRRLSDSKSEEENCFVGFDFEIKNEQKKKTKETEKIEKEPKKAGKKLKKNDFDFLMESSAEKGITKKLPVKTTRQNMKKQNSGESKFKNKPFKIKAPPKIDLKAISPKISSPTKENKKLIVSKKDKGSVKIESIKNLIKEEKPQKSFFSSLNFDDSFFN